MSKIESTMINSKVIIPNIDDVAVNSTVLEAIQVSVAQKFASRWLVISAVFGGGVR